MPDGLLDGKIRVADFEFAGIRGVSIDNSVLDEFRLAALGLDVKGCYMDVVNLYVREQGRGDGTRFLAALGEWADRHGYILCLSPIPRIKRDRKTQRRLNAFYIRNHFVWNLGNNERADCPEWLYRPSGGLAQETLIEPDTALLLERMRKSLSGGRNARNRPVSGPHRASEDKTTR